MSRHRLVSVRTRLRRRILATVLVLAVASALGWMAIEYSLFLYLLYVAVSLLIGAVATSTLIWMLHAWRTPDSLAGSYWNHPAHQELLARIDAVCAERFAIDFNREE